MGNVVARQGGDGVNVGSSDAARLSSTFLSIIAIQDLVPLQDIERQTLQTNFCSVSLLRKTDGAIMAGEPLSCRSCYRLMSGRALSVLILRSSDWPGSPFGG